MLADGCRRARLFDALGAAMAIGARGTPRRLLAMVFATAAGTTAVLSLDATVLLLTPVVLATAARIRADVGEFMRLGAVTVPAAVLASTMGLWLALRVV